MSTLRRLFEPGSSTQTVLLMLMLTALAVWTAFQVVPRTLYYPQVLAKGPGGLQLDVRSAGFLEEAPCKARAERLAAPLRATAVFTVSAVCALGGQADTLAVLSHAPLAEPSSRTAAGDVILYHAPSAALAEAVCMQAAATSATQPNIKHVACFPAMAARP